MTDATTAVVTPELETITELLVRARAAGIRVKVTAGDKVHFRAPPTPEALALVHALRHRQAELVAILRQEADRLDVIHRLASWTPPAPQPQQRTLPGFRGRGR